MSKQRTVYLDVDGILADFERGINEWCNVPARPWTGFHGYREFGISDEAFEETMEYVSFWDSLKVKKEGVALLRGLEGILGEKNVLLATKPFPHGNCLFGKDKWFQETLKIDTRRVYYAHEKERLAQGSHTLLIDDTPDNVNAFANAGGVGILYPMPWNSPVVPDIKQWTEEILDYVRNW